MNTLLHWLTSPEWTQLVKALLHSLWQGALIAAGLALLLRRITNPTMRYRLALAGLGVVVLSAIVTWGVLRAPKAPTLASTPIVDAPVATQPETTGPVETIVVEASWTSAKPQVQWTAWLALLWLIGTSAMLGRASVKVAGAEQLRRSCKPLDNPRIAHLIAEARHAVNVTRRMRVAVTDQLTSPAVVGVLVPTLILPLSLITTLSHEQIRFILLHELAHIRRGDYLANLFQLFAEALLFFNPTVWWISHQIRREREACCDALAIELSGAPADYAQTLVHVAETVLTSSPDAAPAFGNKSKPSSLRDRVQRVLVPGYRPSLRLTWRAMLTALALGGVTLALLAVGARQAVAAAKSDSRSEWVNSLDPDSVEIPYVDVHLWPDFLLVEESHLRERLPEATDPDQPWILDAKDIRQLQPQLLRAEARPFHWAVPLTARICSGFSCRWDVGATNAAVAYQTINVVTDGVTNTHVAGLEVSNLADVPGWTPMEFSMVPLMRSNGIQCSLQLTVSRVTRDAEVTIPSRGGLVWATPEGSVLEGYRQLVVLRHEPNQSAKSSATNSIEADNRAESTAPSGGGLVTLGDWSSVSSKRLDELGAWHQTFRFPKPPKPSLTLTLSPPMSIAQGHPVYSQRIVVCNDGSYEFMVSSADDEHMTWDHLTEWLKSVQEARRQDWLESAILGKQAGLHPPPGRFTGSKEDGEKVVPIVRLEIYPSQGAPAESIKRLTTLLGVLGIDYHVAPTALADTLYAPASDGDASTTESQLENGPEALAVAGDVGSGGKESSYMTPAFVNEGRKRIIHKLDRIRLDTVLFDGLPLGEVVWFLNEEAKKHDPDKKGINFLINPDETETAIVGSATPRFDPLTELAIAPPPEEEHSVELKGIRIKIDPRLTNVRLAEVLDMIVTVAEIPINYSIEDYAVVFSLRSPEVEPLYTRAFKLDPDEFARAVGAVGPLDSLTNAPSAVRGWFESLGVMFTPPKTVFVGGGGSRLWVRATLAELDIIENAVQVINTKPPRVRIRSKIVEMPNDQFDEFLRKTLSVTNKMVAFTGLLAEPQAKAVFETLEQQTGVDILSAPEVLTLIGRQAQIHIVDMKSVVTGTEPIVINGIITNVFKTEQMQVGPKLDVTPRVSSDFISIQMTLTASVTEFLGYDDPGSYVPGDQSGLNLPLPPSVPLPRFRLRQLSTNAVVLDGQTLVLGGFVSETVSHYPDGSERKRPTPEMDKRRLLVFVTPTIIDESGNRIHSSDDMPFDQESIPSQTPPDGGN